MRQASALPQIADPDILCFPSQLRDAVGISGEGIAYLKKLGCPYFGKRTTLRWVRLFLARESGAAALAEAVLAEYSSVASECKSSSPDDSNG